jgi:HSP20 family molecular chaperone IbpA
MVIINLKPRQSKPPVFIVGHSSSPTVAGWRLTFRPNLWSPATDVYETEDRLIVRMEIAGMDNADFNVKLDQNHLVISGVRPDPPESRAYHRMEIPFGEFNTEVEINVPINIEAVEAQYQDGFLYIIMPKAQPRQIRPED